MKDLGTGGKLNYMLQLDSLRAIAVLVVIASHYAHEFFLFFNWGFAAVFLFFVLSGFLISGILLRARHKDERNNTPKILSLKRFYLRRTIRIFPLYYAMVIFGIIMVPAIQDNWVWHVSYTLNFQMALAGKYFSGITGPFWSLGVEEQFYLVWPLIVLFTPLRWLPSVLFIVIFLGPLSRFVCVACNFSPQAVSYLPTSCLDALGLGSLLAFSKHPYGREKYGNFSFGVGAGIGALSFLIILLLHYIYAWAQPVVDILAPLSLSLIFAWIVLKCSEGIGGVAGQALKWQPLIYLGKISYGLYALHILGFTVTKAVFETLSISSRGALSCASLVTTLVIASLSWHFFESPINNLKDKLSDRISHDLLASDAADPGTATKGSSLESCSS